MANALSRLFAPERRQELVALIVACAFFMEMLDGTVIGTSLPQMAISFRENPVNLSIGMSSYLLTLAVFIPASGWIADRFGAKRVFAGAIVVFTLASIFCGLSNSLLEFTLARVLQGMGGALMTPVGRLVVLRNSDKRDLIRNMQFVTIPGLIAPVFGPPLGGFLTTYASWRWIFYLNVPIGIVGVLLVLKFMSESPAVQRRGFDWLGFVLSGAGLAMFVFGLDQFGRPHIDWAFAGTLSAGGAIVCALAVWHLLRYREPLLDISLFSIPTFTIATLLSGTAFRIVISTSMFLWPLLFQIGFGMSAFVSGLLLLGTAGGDLFMKLFAARLLRTYGFRRTLAANGLIATVLILASAAFSAATPVVAIVALLFAIGLSRSVQFGGLGALAYVDVTPDRMSSASSLGSTIQQCGMGLGIAIGALALNGAAFARGERGGAFAVGDFQLAFVAIAGVALVSAIGFLRLTPHAGADASGHREAARAAS